MQKSSGVFSVLVATLLFAAACSQGENTVGKRTPTAAAKKTSAGTVDAATSADARGAAVDDPAVDDTSDTDDAQVEDDAADDTTKDDETKDDAEEPAKDDDADPVKGDGDDDDLPGKGNPGQNPGQTPVQTKPDPIDEPDVVVDLPAEACPYFDPDQPSFVIKKDQFAVGLPPMDVPSGHIKGELQEDNETYIGAFTLFKHQDKSWRLVWDKRAGRVPHDYTLVVVGASNDKCTAYLKFVKQNPRTLNGCFAADTMIRMGNGKDQMIAGITVGDMVLNPVTQKASRVAEVIKGPEAKAMWKVGFAGRDMVITELHPVPVKGGVKQAKDITTNDYIYDENGIIHRVTTAMALPVKNTTVYNVRLEGPTTADHMVLANGLVSGDLYLQRKLAEGSQTASR